MIHRQSGLGAGFGVSRFSQPQRESFLDESGEALFFAGCERFGFGQQLIVKIECRFHDIEVYRFLYAE